MTGLPQQSTHAWTRAAVLAIDLAPGQAEQIVHEHSLAELAASLLVCSPQVCRYTIQHDIAGLTTTDRGDEIYGWPNRTGSLVLSSRIQLAADVLARTRRLRGFLSVFSSSPKYAQREGLGGGGRLIRTISMVVKHISLVDGFKLQVFNPGKTGRPGYGARELYYVAGLYPVRRPTSKPRD